MSHKIGKRVYRNIDFLKLLVKTNSEKKRKAIFKAAKRGQLLLLVEICYNILKGNFKLTRRQKLRIIPYAEFIRALGRARSENSAKRIVQRGSGFVSFATILTPIIIEAIKYLSNNNGK